MSISLGDELGKGTFGIVLEALFEGKPTWAVKVSGAGKKTLLNEDFMLRYLHQDKEASVSHIIKRVDLIPIGSEKIGLVLELLGVNLKTYYSSKETVLSLEKIRQITSQLAKALSFLYKNDVIHGDIKPENILMSADGESVTLADFGLATFSGPAYNPPNREVQTIWYRSPEVVLQITATEAIDVWSLAAVVAEIYCTCPLFASGDGEAKLIAYHRIRLESSYPADLVAKGTNRGQHIFKEGSEVKAGGQPLSQVIQTISALKEEDSKQLRDLLGKMFAYDPEKRATPDEILEDPFILQEKELSKEDIELLVAYGLF